MDTKMYWHNFVTGEYEYIDTPSDFTNYIPQEPAALNLYKLYIQHMGLSPLESCTKVLEACVGKQGVEQNVQPTGCYACADTGIIRCDGIAVNCPVCNPATSG